MRSAATKLKSLLKCYETQQKPGDTAAPQRCVLLELDPGSLAVEARSTRAHPATWVARSLRCTAGARGSAPGSCSAARVSPQSSKPRGTRTPGHASPHPPIPPHCSPSQPSAVRMPRHCPPASSRRPSRPGSRSLRGSPSRPTDGCSSPRRRASSALIKNGALLATPFLDAARPRPGAADASTATWSAACSASPSIPAFPAVPFVYIYYSVCKVAGRGHLPDRQEPRRARQRGVPGQSRPRRPGEPASSCSTTSTPTPASTTRGWLGFGPLDGKLYVSVGDGGTGGAKAQDLASLNGKILRLEPNGSVPFDNPFVGLFGARPEVCALGFRNPWRCRFHPDGRLFCGDVGQAAWEEIDWVVAGRQLRLAHHRGRLQLRRRFPQFIRPIYAYDHSARRLDHRRRLRLGDQLPGRLPAELLLRRLRLAVDPARRARAPTALTVMSVTDFAESRRAASPTCVAGPDGALYYTNIVAGTVQRIAAIGSNRPPVARATATPAQGAAPLTVQFSSADSSRSRRRSAHAACGTSATAARPRRRPPRSTRTRHPGGYTATLTVSDGRAPTPGTDTVTVPITVGTPPVVTITQPTADVALPGRPDHRPGRQRHRRRGRPAAGVGAALGDPLPPRRPLAPVPERPARLAAVVRDGDAGAHRDRRQLRDHPARHRLLRPHGRGRALPPAAHVTLRLETSPPGCSSRSTGSR